MDDARKDMHNQITDDTDIAFSEETMKHLKLLPVEDRDWAIDTWLETKEHTLERLLECVDAHSRRYREIQQAIALRDQSPE